jgi:hypothetical protein
MKSRFIQILINTFLGYSVLAVLKCLTIFYFIVTDEYFYRGEFNNDELLLKAHNFLLYIKLVPILIFLLFAFFLKKIMDVSWFYFILSSCFALIIFRFFDVSINTIFMLTENHIINVFIATLSNILIIYFILFFHKKG